MYLLGEGRHRRGTPAFAVGLQWADSNVMVPAIFGGGLRVAPTTGKL